MYIYIYIYMYIYIHMYKRALARKPPPCQTLGFAANILLCQPLYKKVYHAFGHSFAARPN